MLRNWYMCAVTEKTVSLKNDLEDKKISPKINILVHGIYVCVCVCTLAQLTRSPSVSWQVLNMSNVLSCAGYCNRLIF